MAKYYEIEHHNIAGDTDVYILRHKKNGGKIGASLKREGMEYLLDKVERMEEEDHKNNPRVKAKLIKVFKSDINDEWYENWVTEEGQCFCKEQKNRDVAMGESAIWKKVMFSDGPHFFFEEKCMT